MDTRVEESRRIERIGEESDRQHYREIYRETNTEIHRVRQGYTAIGTDKETHHAREADRQTNNEREKDRVWGGYREKSSKSNLCLDAG